MAEENIKITFEIDGIEKTVSSVEELEKEMANLGKTAKKTEKDLEKTGGKGLGKFKSGLQSIGKVGKAAFRGIGTAIKATGIGLLVGLVAKLVEQFMKTDKGAKILQGSLAVLGVIFEQIEKVVNFLWEYLVETFTNPQKAVDDLKAGVESLGNWFSSLGDYIKNNFLLLLQKMQKEILEARIAWNNFTGDTEEAEALTQELAALEEQMKGTKEEIMKAADEVTEPFEKAAEFIKETVTTIVEESKAAITASNAAIDAAARFAALQNQLIVENAKLTKELEEQRKISEDTTRTYEERKEALDKVNEANEKLAENALKEAKALEGYISLQLQTVSNDEDRRALQAELAQATADRIAKEQEAEIVRLESQRLAIELEQEEVARKQAINDTIEGLRMENIENEYEAAMEGLRIAEEATLRELELLLATEEEKQAIRDEFAKRREKLAEDEALKQKQLDADVNAAKVAVARQGLDAIGALVQAFSGENEAAAKRNFKIQKALSLANATIGGVEATLNAYKTAQASPITAVFPAYPIVQAGLAGAFAAAQIATIAKSKFQGGGAGGGGGQVPQTGAGQVPGGAPQFNPQQALAETVGDNEAPGSVTVEQNGSQSTVVRAYVVDSEVTSQQEATRKIENLASL